MNQIAGKGNAGSLVALGANVRVPPNRVIGGIIMLETRDGFEAVALAAGKICPDGVKILSLSDVAFLTSSAFIKF